MELAKNTLNRLDSGCLWLAIRLIRIYRLTLSPWLGTQCRFYPSCSHYALKAFEIHGFIKGAALVVARIGRCHPFHPGGVDFVPESGIVPRSATGEDA